MSDQLKIGPNSKPQAAFLGASEYEVLFGGAAYGGKTWSLVVDPLRYKDVSGMTGIIFRRTYPELERAVLPLTYKIYPHFGGEYHVQSKTWTFPSGMTIKLGYMQFSQSWIDYKGGSFTYEAYDELTAFEEEQWTMMRPWNRTECSVAPYRRATSNPGGQGHVWVRKYFVDTCPSVVDGPPRWCEEAKIWWQPMSPGPTYYWRDADDPTRTLTRKFVPARIFDNADGIRADPEYLTKLLALPAAKRAALLEGRWDVFEGAFFNELNENYHKIRPVNPPPGSTFLGAIDYGNPSVFELAYMDYEGNIVFIDESYVVDAPVEDKANAVADVLLDHKLPAITLLYDTDMAINLKHYAPTEYSPLEVFQSILMQRMSENMPDLEPVSKEPRRQWRTTSNETVRNLLHWKILENGKRVGPKLFLTDNCPRLWESITSLVHDPASQNGLDYRQARANDHAYDALKTICMRFERPYKRDTDRTWAKIFSRGATEPVRWEVGVG